MTAERDALAALVAAWDSEAYNREWGQRMTAAIAAARAALAAPAQGEPQERMGTHWDGCSTEGGPRHYDCAVAAIAALRAERDDWKRKYGDANEWGLRNTAAWKDRAERAEAECADLRRRLDEHIDDKERALRLSAKESTRLTTEVERLRADAERYRWLRDKAPQEWAGWADERDAAEATAPEVDAAIDKARNVQSGGQERSSVGRTDVVAGSSPAASVPPDPYAIDAARAKVQP